VELEGERRLATVVRADVRESTSLLERIGSEAWGEIMNCVLQMLGSEICRLGGEVSQFLGDGLMAFFGVTTTHEDDPERAVLAALAMQRAMKAYAAELVEREGIELLLRVGVNTGEVIATTIGDSRQHSEDTALGEAIALAARMESAAEPGTVLVSKNTYRLVQPLFEWEALGEIAVKGISQPVAVYRPLAHKGLPGKARGIAGLESPLVGRRAEFRALQEAVKRLRAGVGGIVTLVGEAGIGKSRLVAELRKEEPGEQDPNLQWVTSGSLSRGTSVAYLPWLDVLRGLLGVTLDDPPASVRDALQERVEGLEDVYPFLARLLSLPLGAEVETTLENVEGERLKVSTFRAVEALIEEVAQERSLVVVLEDLHWADPISIELLKELLALTDRGIPLLFICVFRPETEHGCWDIKETAARFYRHRHMDIWLDPLSAAESEELLGNLLRVEGLPSELGSSVLSHAEGNPLYVEEIIRSLIDGGTIERDEATGGWRAARGVAAIAIPETLHGVLMARIDRLEEGTRRVLKLAAVVGRIFRYRVLAAITHEERELERHLLTLQREEMIRERARVPELEYIFRHHLVHEAAYRSLLRKERRVFHRQVAGALEEFFPERLEEQAGLLARHWERAGEPEKALKYLLQAGDRARRLGASLEAVDFYQRALQSAAELEAGGEGTELHRIHESLGDVYLVNLSRHDEALEHYRSFLASARSEEDVARGARKVAGVHLLRGNLTEARKHYETALDRLRPLLPLAEASRVHFGLSYLLVYRNRLDEAEEQAQAALEIARQVGDTRGLADANKVLGVIAAQRGDLEAACEYDERSLKFYRQLGDLARTAQACNNVGDSYRLLGQMGRALERLEEGLELARRIGDTRDEALLLQTEAELYLDQGEWEEAIAHLEQALPLAERSGAVARMIEVHRILGSAYVGVGRLEEARHHLEIAEVQSRDTELLRFAAGTYLDLGCLNAAQGEFDEAERYLEMALEAAGPEPSDAFLGLLHRCCGQLQSRRGDWEEAVDHLERSLEFLERTNLLADVGKTRLSLGAAYESRDDEGDRGQACEQLLAAMSIFRQIEARGYLAQAEVRVEELRCTAPPTHPADDREEGG
jgi:class 3 adenylate cyclase/tetratricopeptide (TPR) repeat protein